MALALALYLLPILLQVAASRVRHHHNAPEVQDTLAGEDLADILIPILRKQELESKAHNQSDEKIHALKKLIQKSHVAIILAKPHNKGENHSEHHHSKHISSQDVKNQKHAKHLSSDEQENVYLTSASSEDTKKLKHVKHHSSGLAKDKNLKNVDSEDLEKHLNQTSSNKLKNLESLSIASSDEISEENSHVVSLENKEEIKDIQQSVLNTKYEDSNENNLQKLVVHKDKVKHKESLEEDLIDILDSKDKSSESDVNDSVEENKLQKSGLHSKNVDSGEVNSHKTVIDKDGIKDSLEKSISHRGPKEEKKHEVNINNSRDLNSSNESSKSNKASGEKSNLQKSGLNTLKDSHDENSHEAKNKDVLSHLHEKYVVENEKHREKLEHNDEESESNEESLIENNHLHELKTKQKESQKVNSHKELKHKNTVSIVKLASQKGKHNNGVKYLNGLKNVLDSRDKKSKYDQKDSVEDGDSLMGNIGLVRVGKSLHFYEKYDNNKKHKDGVRNLFFHFAL